MVFNSFVFVVFFALVYGLYIVLRHRAQNVLLLVASYVFYGWWDWRFLSLVLASTVLDYVCGLRIVDDASRRRLWISLSMAGNLGLLFFFKYFNFFADSTARALAFFGLEADWTTLNIVLPVGISFYTFQTMSYTLDIYRGTLAPTRSLLNFSLYVAFFPQLVAGPIERASHLLPQVEKPRRPTYQGLREGFWLILHGYLLKVVVADNLGPFADEIFNHPERARGLAVPLALLAFTFQIYGDFAGYSNIARGLCKWMGFDLMVNFRMPYFAANPSDFWRRWHISLSTWLRDYLYIPLGGNRGGSLLTHRNLMLTMVLGGLWHGAAWHFVLWGLYHGLLLSGHRMMQPLLDRIRPQNAAGAAVWRLGSIALFFLFTLGGWLLFRVNHLSDLALLARNALDLAQPTGQVCLLTLACFVPPVLAVDLWQEWKRSDTAVALLPAPLRAAVYLTWFALIILCGAVGQHAFIYFQF